MSGNEVSSTTVKAAENDAAAPSPESLKELTDLIQTLLGQTQDRFQTMSDQIVKRIDEMGKRIDDLEGNINDLMTQVGADGADSSAQ